MTYNNNNENQKGDLREETLEDERWIKKREVTLNHDV